MYVLVCLMFVLACGINAVGTFSIAADEEYGTSRMVISIHPFMNAQCIDRKDTHHTKCALPKYNTNGYLAWLYLTERRRRVFWPVPNAVRAIGPPVRGASRWTPRICRTSVSHETSDTTVSDNTSDLDGRESSLVKLHVVNDADHVFFCAGNAADEWYAKE